LILNQLHGLTNAPWFDAECRQLRRNARRLERRYRRTHEAGDRNEWTCYLREMRRQYKEKERQFWEDRISNNSRNPKKLWRNMSSLLGREGKSSTSLPSFTPEAYLDFLEAKVGKVRSETSGGSPPLFNDVPFRLANLQPCSIGMLERVIRMSPSKSCELDPIPTFLLKEFLGDILPFLHLLCNSSLVAGYLPNSQKRAVVTPALKKHGLDCDVLNNYRPISNLSYLSKILEKLVSIQIISHLTEYGLMPDYQSGFRAGHSTETVLVRLLSDIFTAMDSGEVTLLALLDVSAAFDSVDHDLLLERLRRSFGIQGNALSWLESFLRGRTQSVIIGDKRSGWRTIEFGVPQGSVLGPLLYVLFTAEIPRIIQSSGLTAHQYADDVQAYVHCRATEAGFAMNRLEKVLDDLHRWMRSNRLKLNPDKTQFIWIENRYQLPKIDYQSLSAGYPGAAFQKSVVNLGVTLDQELTLSSHIGNTCRSGFYQLRQLRLIRRHLTDKTAATLVHAFVMSRVDYCNAVLIGIAKQQMSRLQMILNTAARLLLRIPRFGHISSAITNTLHWLPVHERVTFKVCCLVWNCVAGTGPAYLRELCVWSSVDSVRRLRSSDMSLLKVPYCRSATTQRRGFVIVGPAAWNGLPLQLRLLSSDCRHNLI